MTVKEGTQCIARHAIGRKDPIKFTVRGVLTSPDSRSPGRLTSLADFRKLYAQLGSRCGTLTDVEGIWRDVG